MKFENDTMKKIACLISLLCIGIFYSNAQPVFNSNNWPATGSSYTEFTVVNPVFTPGNDGPNQLWDFSALTPSTTTSSLYYGLALGSTNASQVCVYKNNDVFSYTLNSNNCMYKGSAIGNPAARTDYYPNLEYLRFPLTYNSAYNSSYRASFNDQHPPNGGEVGSIQGACSVVADGYGTLITPAGTFQYCLRVKFTDNYIDSTTYNYNPSTLWVRNVHSVKYIWLSTDLNPLLTLQVDSELIHHDVHVYAKYCNGITGIDDVFDSYSLQAFPNPLTINNSLTINANQLDPGDAELFVSDNNGRILHDIKLRIPYSYSKLITVDLPHYTPGIYFLKLQQGNRSRQNKLVVQ